jgi:hypothetical protein
MTGFDASPPPASQIPENGYPLRVSATLDQPSRGLWLVKWLLALPHYVVLAFLWLAFFVLTVVAFFAILFTGRYPRSIFDFNVGVMRWSWRVNYYSYSALGTDRYPPFTLADDPDYPARLDVAYPARLSRGLVLVKWWLLAIPHYIVVALLVSGITWTTNDERWTFGSGLIPILVLVAGIILLFRGSYPASLFDLVLGLNRWVWRVSAYVSLMTDEYPPFRLDMGATDPSGSPAGRFAGAGPQDVVPAAPLRWGPGRVVAAIAAALAMLVGTSLAAGGGAVLVADSIARDDDGFLTSPRIEVASLGNAVVVEDLEIETDAPRWAYPDRVLGDVRIRVRPQTGSETFVGIASAADVSAFLSGSSYSVVRRVQSDGTRYRERTGTSAPAAPGTVDIWTASQTGTGEVVLTWTVQEGDWSVVVMNADASAGVDTTADVAATVPVLWGIGLGLLVVGLVLLVLGVVGLVVAVVRRPQHVPPQALEEAR